MQAQQRKQQRLVFLGMLAALLCRGNHTADVTCPPPHEASGAEARPAPPGHVPRYPPLAVARITSEPLPVNTTAGPQGVPGPPAPRASSSPSRQSRRAREPRPGRPAGAGAGAGPGPGEGGLLFTRRRAGPRRAAPAGQEAEGGAGSGTGPPTGPLPGPVEPQLPGGVSSRACRAVLRSGCLDSPRRGGDRRRRTPWVLTSGGRRPRGRTAAAASVRRGQPAGSRGRPRAACPRTGRRLCWATRGCGGRCCCPPLPGRLHTSSSPRTDRPREAGAEGPRDCRPRPPTERVRGVCPALRGTQRGWAGLLPEEGRGHGEQPFLGVTVHQRCLNYRRISRGLLRVPLNKPTCLSLKVSPVTEKTACDPRPRQ